MSYNVKLSINAWTEKLEKCSVCSRMLFNVALVAYMIALISTFLSASSGKLVIIWTIASAFMSLYVAQLAASSVRSTINVINMKGPES